MRDFAQFFSLHRKFLIYNLVMRNLKVRYRKSVFGFLWTLIVPASTTIVYYFVFKYIAKLGGENYSIFLLAGIIPWTFFSTALAAGTESLVANFSILSKVPISCSSFPFADTCSAFVNFLLSLPVLIVAAAIFGIYPSLPWLLLPVIFAVLFLQSYCLALILSVAFVYLRDVRHLIGIAIQIWMYLTPILYARERIPPEYEQYFYFNPLFSIFDSTHEIFLHGHWPIAANWINMLIWTTVLLVFAFTVFKYFRYRIVEKL